MSSTHDFSNEATTRILFPSDLHYAEFRDEVRDRYHPTMVDVSRWAVSGRGTEAEVKHARNLGAELKGLAHAHHEGRTVRTIFARED